MHVRLVALLVAVSLGLSAAVAVADNLDPKAQSQVDEIAKQVAAWACDPAIVDAVKQANASPDPQYKDMTQEKWTSLAITDPLVRGLSKNAVAQFIKGKKTAAISEAFVSAADGTKVALLSKTTNWCHKGKAKHEQPMTGKNWQGPVEMDESAGVRQVQISVPVKDGDKPVGSLVVGINIGKLAE